MIDIIVCRNPASAEGCLLDDPNLIWGDDIIDDLLCTTGAAQERGKVEIDENYSNRKNISLVLSELEFKQPGNIYGITDFSKTTNGLLKSFQIQVSMSESGSFVAQSNLTLETNIDD